MPRDATLKCNALETIQYLTNEFASQERESGEFAQL